MITQDNKRFGFISRTSHYGHRGLNGRFPLARSRRRPVVAGDRVAGLDRLATFNQRASIRAMRSSNVIRTSLEWSLCLLLIAATLLSVEWLVVGVTFGFNLWRPDRIFAIAVWFAAVLFPAFVAWALMKSLKERSLATTARLAAVTWTFAAFWLWDVYVARWGL
jgi:hypothetical protein